MPRSHAEPARVALCLPYGFAASTVYALSDLFHLAGYEVVCFGPDSPLRSHTGSETSVRTQLAPRFDAVVLVGAGGRDLMGVKANLERSYDFAAACLVRLTRTTPFRQSRTTENGQAHSALPIVASSCTAAYFLARAGWLEGCKATSAWWLIDSLRAEFPRVGWHPERVLVEASPASGSASGRRHKRILSSGGALCSLELGRTIVRIISGDKMDRRLSRLLVLPDERQSQSPYRLTPPATHPVAHRLAALPAETLKSLNLGAMSRLVGLSPRSLHRFCLAHFGLSPHRWLTRQRLEYAQRLLETGDDPVDALADLIGYADPPSFVRAFKSAYGTTPARYRARARPVGSHIHPRAR